MTHLDRLFGEIAQEEDRLLSTSQRRATVRQRLIVEAGRNRRSGLWSPWLSWSLAAACAVATVGGVTQWQHSRGSELSVTAGDNPVTIARGAWIDAPATAALPLRFSDGSRIEVTPRSRMRLLELDGRGAQLALESGRADVDVAHGSNRRWELRAGPFVVHVTGTKFDLSWVPNEDRFELVLQEGQVELVGCGFGAGRKLVAGQRVRAACHDNSVQIAYERVVLPEASTTSPAIASSVQMGPELQKLPNPPKLPNLDDTVLRNSTEPRGVAVRSGHAGPEDVNAASMRPNWAALAKQGKYREAMGVVERLGFSTEVVRMNVDDLALLAETARHAREPNLARQVSLELRRRFPGTMQANLAAFSLGVLEFDQLGAYSKAATWFRAYLQETPTGPLTRESRGRLMEALYRIGSAEARGLALEYLRDYPAGPHAELAKRICQTE